MSDLEPLAIFGVLALGGAGAFWLVWSSAVRRGPVLWWRLLTGCSAYAALLWGGLYVAYAHYL